MVSHILQNHSEAVVCQGGFCLTYQIIRHLQEKGILVAAVCSKRMVKDDENQKLVTFAFGQFRRYGWLFYSGTVRSRKMSFSHGYGKL